MPTRREQYRIPIQRMGHTIHDGRQTSCRIVEVTDAGLGFETPLPLKPGDHVELTFELAPGCSITCTVAITHSASPRVGGPIAAMTSEHRRSLDQFIRDHNTLCLAGV